MQKKEKFEIKKFLAGINPFDLVGWSKAMNNLTHFVIIAIIIFGIVFGIGYWKGLKNRPVSIAEGEDKIIHVMNGNGIKHEIEIRGGRHYFDGQLIKEKHLVKGKTSAFKLQPGIGVVGLRPAGFLGLWYYKKIDVDVFGNQHLIGGGISYRLNIEKPFVLENTYIGIGGGYDILRDDKRYTLYFKVNL